MDRSIIGIKKLRKSIAIDNIVNGEVNLPPGDKTKLFERIRQVGKGYTIIGTNYTYNSRNQLVHRENLIRYEDYDYKYDDAGNLLTDGRSKFEWNARGQLTKVTFPDGFGEKYTYDTLGRRVTKTRFDHNGNGQQTTTYRYKGDTWVLTDEIKNGDNEDGESGKMYTYDANDRPLSITFKGQTFWYVYNGHGDVMALTDKDGKVAARYEYDAWGLVTGMYNRYGEKVRESIGFIGDLGTGNGSPGSVQGPEDDSGNTVPDYHPGNGNGKGNGNGNGNGKKSKDNTGDTSFVTTKADSSTESVTATLDALIADDTEPTDDITTDLVKENPIRYAGYYWDRKTQYYYLQARYYDPRPARFISEDSYEGEIDSPLTLNQYTYAANNPLMYVDPSGHKIIFYTANYQELNKEILPEVMKITSKTDPRYKVAWNIMDKRFKSILSANRFKYLFGLLTQTSPYKNSAGNAAWAKGEFLRVYLKEEQEKAFVLAISSLGSPIGSTNKSMGVGSPKATGNLLTRNVTKTSELDKNLLKNLKNAGTIKSGGRSGEGRPLNGNPNSYVKTDAGHTLVYDGDGRLIYDISRERVKMTVWDKAPNGNYYPRDVKLEGRVPLELLK
ncbi:RHS repeat-associated core domain-containing protein [Cohnella pontilimi]|uniref:RHS repeat-associated core domain-containing protein n=1 Tax=Cohnella pontilimi TaxID=2564100 RepID=A0A4V5LSA9_9BACL|nr:RHS repeat-associated core domain-containing protein [Cohnella pontilimi]TJY42399.1 RHS repeat-associated core domain-containing protein [Cohnella pontilimi]